MATLKSAGNLASEAATLATSFEYVLYNGMLYMPVDYVDEDTGVIPPVERKTWKPITDDMLMVKAREQCDTMFKDPAQFRSFQFMVMQESARCPSAPPWLLVKTEQGMKVLHEDGTLQEPDGTFVPNTVYWTLNEDQGDKAALKATIADWVGGDDELVTSLLRHLATALAPHWSAGKYVLLIGNGRNGKSLLMTMLTRLFGNHNCSSITRQQISDADKALFDLNNKLLNVVFDGPADFVKDSGREKSLITGETVAVRKLYANAATDVQTNALFIEGLNQEPRSRDKSSALQARLVRFWFPNKYADDQSFWGHMCSERMLGALLSLLIDHYVLQSEVAVMLSPTQASKDAQIEHSVDNSLALQYLIHLDETESLPVEEFLLDMHFGDLVSQFQQWRKALGDPTLWDSAALLNMFRPVLITERRSARIGGVPRKARVIVGLSEDAALVVGSLREEDAHATAVVED
jgi:phage/plasmid-associated DNA primase